MALVKAVKRKIGGKVCERMPMSTRGVGSHPPSERHHHGLALLHISRVMDCSHTHRILGLRSMTNRLM